MAILTTLQTDWNWKQLGQGILHWRSWIDQLSPRRYQKGSKKNHSWFYGSHSWFPWNQLCFASPIGKCSIIAKVVVKQSKVDFTEINYGFRRTNYGFFCFLSDNVEDWVDRFSSFIVVSLVLVVISSSLSEFEVVWSEELSELSYWIIILILINFQGWTRKS